MFQLQVIAIHQARIADRVAHLHPGIAARWHREEAIDDVVRERGDDDSSEKVQVVNVRGANGDLGTHCPCETNHVDDDTENVGDVGAPVDTKGVPVGVLLASRVQIFNLVISLAHDIVVAEDHASNAREEDGVCREVSGEAVAVGEEIPGIDGKPNESADVGSTTNVEIFGKKCRHVRAGGHGVGGNVGTKLGQGESKCEKEDAKPLTRTSAIQEELEYCQRVPGGLANENDRRR